MSISEEKNITGRGHSKVKVSESAIRPVYLWNSKRPLWMEWSEKRGGGEAEVMTDNPPPH